MGNQILIHHGIKGQRWGVRRYQNEDGTRTALGKKHEGVESSTGVKKSRNDVKKEKVINKAVNTARNEQKRWEDEASKSREYIKQLKSGSRDRDFSSTEERDEAIKYEKSELKRYESHAKNWIKTQDKLMNMDISDLSVKELKKKTTRTALIKDQ